MKTKWIIWIQSEKNLKALRGGYPTHTVTNGIKKKQIREKRELCKCRTNEQRNIREKKWAEGRATRKQTFKWKWKSWEKE